MRVRSAFGATSMISCECARCGKHCSSNQSGSGNFNHNERLDEHNARTVQLFLWIIQNGILREPKNPGRFSAATLKQQPEMLKTLALCFAFRCNARLNITRLDCSGLSDL
jgi:hypothetical protein